MKVTETPLKGAYIIEPKIFQDERGYFFESFNQARFNEQIGQEVQFVQDNESRSSYGVLRGMHYQLEPCAQAKLVRVLDGNVLDVIIDIRQGSPTYGQHFSIELSSDNKLQLFVSKGFAHGFVTLSKEATFLYKCDNFYAPDFEGGILYNDPDIKIDWVLPEKDLILSSKDQELKPLAETNPKFAIG